MTIPEAIKGDSNLPPVPKWDSAVIITNLSSNDSTGGTQNGSAEPNTKQSPPPGDSTNKLTDPNIGNQPKESKVLNPSLVKPVIRDDYNGIFLIWIVHELKVPQADIQKHLARNQEEYLPPVLDAYQALFPHKHEAIEIKIKDAGTGASLISLRRSHVVHRGILFKGISGLYFVLMSEMDRKGEPQSKFRESMKVVDLARPT